MKTPAFLLALILGVGCASAAAAVPNLLGLYVGAAVGDSDVRASGLQSASFGLPEFDEHATGWKVLVGLRPIRLLAAEVSYIDFGHPNSSASGTGTAAFFIWHSNVQQRASTVTGLLYLPVPIPFLGAYVRAGLARLEIRGSSSPTCGPGICPNIFFPPSSIDRKDSDFIYGAGLQAKFSALSVRLEYERINDRFGDPSLLSAGITWMF